MQTSGNIHCPHLPLVDGELPITHAKPFREECGVRFYTACLELAQNQWKAGLPAQALLQLNKSFMAILPPDAPITREYPIGYEAVQWIILHSTKTPEYLGNPVRHYQHLATRMNFKQPLAELRVWRAWSCFHLSESILLPKEYPRDYRQIERESVEIPEISVVLDNLSRLSPHSHEVDVIKKLLP